jgi:hypothetical protein
MSVAFDAQGEIVPRRGPTTIVSAVRGWARSGFAVVQQAASRSALGAGQRGIAPAQCTKRAWRSAMRRAARLQPAEQGGGAKAGSALAAFEAGEVQGLGRHAKGRVWVAGARARQGRPGGNPRF